MGEGGQGKRAGAGWGEGGKGEVGIYSSPQTPALALPPPALLPEGLAVQAPYTFSPVCLGPGTSECYKEKLENTGSSGPPVRLRGVSFESLGGQAGSRF